MSDTPLYICENWYECAKSRGVQKPDCVCMHVKPHEWCHVCTTLKCPSEDGVPGSLCRLATDADLVENELVKEAGHGQG